jgi:predicted MFS family arabinose efflux permease
MRSGPEAPGEGAGLSRRLVLLMAVTTGLSAASLYYAQPLLESIRRSFHLSEGEAGLIVSLTQIGYITGLVLLVPLGDRIARRRLIPTLVGLLAVALLVASFSPDAAVLLVASFVVGLISVAAQVTVAFSASLASDANRGRTVGTVMSGLLLGILLARTASGYLASVGGWRTPFQVAAGVMAVLALVLARALPVDHPVSSGSYLRVLASVPTILVEEPVILARSAFGACAFGAFNALWTPLAFLLSGRPYHYSTGTIGLFGLLGAAGALSASLAGRVADRGRTLAMTGGTALCMLASWALVAAGRTSAAALIAGVVVLDFAVQGLHITNQSVIYSRRPEARSRITSAYMALYFVGGVAGSLAASNAYAAGGWAASASVGAAFSAAAVARWVVSVVAGRRRDRSATRVATAVGQ